MAYWGNEPAKVAVKVGANVITTTEIADGQVYTADILDDAITAQKVDDDGTGFRMGSLGLGASVSGSEKLTVGGTASFSGAITGNLTGNASGTAATVTTAAQTNITSLGTLTALQIDNVNIDGNTITTTNTNGTLTITPNGTGNVDLNTDRLNIQSTEGESTSIRLSADEGDDSGDDWLLLSNTDNTFVIGNDASGSNVAQITLTPNSTVASSTTAIAGNTTIAGDLEINTDGGSNLSTYKQVIDWRGAGTPSAFMLRLENSDGTNTPKIDFVLQDQTGGANEINSSLALRLGSGGSTTMYLDSSQKVGIGTTSVDEVLHVYGTSNPAIKIEAPAGQRPQIISESGDATECQILFNEGATTHSMVQGGCSGNQTLKFYTGGTTLGMTIDASQNTTIAGGLGLRGTAPNSTMALNVEYSTTNYIMKIQNDHATDGHGVLIKAGDDANVDSLLVQDYNASNTNFRVKGNGDAYMRGSVDIDGYGAIGNTSIDSTYELLVGNIGNNTNVKIKATTDSARLYLDAEDTAGEYSNLWFQAGGTNKAGIYSDNSGNLRFTSGGASQRMMIASGGTVGIGSDGNAWKLHVKYDSSGTTSGVAHFENTHDSSVNHEEVVRIQFSGMNDASGAHFVNFYDRGGDIGRINCASASTVSYSTSSDYRLKENEVALADGLSKVNQLKPYRFNWKKDPSFTMDGFFAHEVQELVPIAVNGEKDGVDDDGEIIKQTMDMTFLIPMMVSAIQELTARLEALENA